MYSLLHALHSYCCARLSCACVYLVYGDWVHGSKCFALFAAFPVIQRRNDTTIEDPIVGTLILTPLGTSNLIITIVVTSDPCPTVQWRLHGVEISGDSISPYLFNDPCSDSEAVSPFTFTLSIWVVTLNTSGQYTAIFTNYEIAEARIYVTVPGKKIATGFESSRARQAWKKQSDCSGFGRTIFLAAIYSY